MDNTAIISILISLLTISSTIFAVILQRKTEKIKIIENQLSQSKYKAYADLVEIFYDTLKDVKNNKESDTDVLREKIMNAKKDLFIFGSDSVFKKFNDWLCFTSENAGDKKHMKFYLELMLEIRKDMRGDKTKITKTDIMTNLMQKRDEVNKMKYMWED